MSVDPNVYALSIQLQLDSADAFSTLEEFGNMASDVEDNISAAAQNSINSITGMVDTLNQSLSAVVVTTGEFNTASSKLEVNLSQAASSLSDMYDTQEDSLQDLEKRLVHLQKIDKLQEGLEKSLENEHKTGEEYLALINNWIGALENKNLVHDTEAGMIKAEQGLLENLTSETESLTENFESSDVVLRRIRASLATIWGLIKLFDSETENFVQANYRAYGSQQQLVNSTRNLSSELGVTRQAAIETYKALADVKTPREEIDKLAKVVSIANRTTGVSAQTIAEYSRNLRVMGFDAEASRRHITMLTESMRKYGLSQSDVNSLMSQGGMDAYMMGQMFGGASDQIERMAASKIHLAGFGKELGLSAESANEFHKWLSQDIGAMQQFGSLARMQIKDAADFEQAQIRAGLAVHARLQALREAEARGEIDHNKFLAQQEALADAHFGGNKAAMAAVEAMGKEAKAIGATGDAAGDYARVVEQLTARQMDQWSEANDTLTAQLSILKNMIVGTLGPAVQWLADGLKNIIKVLIMVIKPIAYVIRQFISFVDWVEANVPVLGWFVTALKVALVVLGVLVVGLIVAGGALATFATAFATSTAVVQGSANVIRMVGQSIVAVANAIGQSIRAIFTGLGQGLAALGRSVQPVIIPLMQLGVAVLLVGAGFWLMGMGMAAAAEHGWAAVGMLAAMTVAMIVMLVTFAIIATVAGPLIPLMLGLAVVVLILGAAAMLAGLGMYFMGMAVEQIAMYGLAAAAALPALAGGILLVAMAGLVGFAGIMLLSVALWALAIPVMLLGIGMTMLATAINSLSADNIVPAAQALLLASLYFVGAGLLLMVAGPLLAVGAALVLVASVALMIASPFLIVASTLMVVAAGIMFTAGTGLLVAAMMLFTAGLLLLPAGVMLAIGAGLLAMAAPLLGIAGVLLIPASVLLMVGAVFLGIAAALLFPAAMMMMVAGVAIGIGGIMMLRGMMSMMAAAGMMAGAAWTMFWAAGALAVALAFLVPVAPVMMAVGVMMAIGGMALLVGAMSIYYASLWLNAGAILLEPAALLMQVAMDAMLPAAVKTYQAGMWFIVGATYMLIGASLLMAATFAIGATAFAMLFMVPVLMIAAVAYMTAAVIMLIGSIVLMSAATIMQTAAGLLQTSAVMVSDAAARLISADALMLVASVSMMKNSIFLIAAAGVLLAASSTLFFASAWLLPAAIGIYVGMSWLESATRRFRRSTEDISKMGKGMYEFALAFDIMSNAPIGSIGEAVDAALDAMPGVSKLARELDKSAVQFQTAADKFVKPVREIAGSLEELGAAMANMGNQGMMVQEDMDKLGTMLDRYTNLLESTAARIELAVVSKAQPAMAAARNEGLEDAVRSEAITTVQVKDQTEGDKAIVDETVLLMQEQNGYLSRIADQVDGAGEGGGKNDIATIVDLLETYLPELNTHKSGLTNELNQWMK